MQHFTSQQAFVAAAKKLFTSPSISIREGGVTVFQNYNLVGLYFTFEREGQLAFTKSESADLEFEIGIGKP